MIFDVLVWRITLTYTDGVSPINYNTNIGPTTLDAGKYIHVRINDATLAITADVRSSATEGGGSYFGTLTEGPYLFTGLNGMSELVTASPFYQFCQGTTLRRIDTDNAFPYGVLLSVSNASECYIPPTCDLEIASGYSVTPATGPANADGSVTVSGTSSNGVIKYSLTSGFDYATAGQISGTFSGLYPGNYTIYAQDEAGCTDSVTVAIEITEVYNVRYRLDYTDFPKMSRKGHRLDILQRAYTGDLEEICSGEEPVTFRWDGDMNDPSKPMVASSAEIQLWVEESGQFTDLFLSDDRKYKVIYYIDGNIYWTGFMVPEFFTEPYVFEPYAITITASDQLGELKSQDFYDLDGNKIKGDLKAIKIIAEILKKTGLHLNIRSGLNVFEDTMDVDPEDDPLDQAYVDSRIYYTEKGVPDKCDTVITSFPKSFRAQIFQSMGMWWIIRLSDTIGVFDYRDFDENGDYLTNSFFNPLVELDFPRAIIGAATEAQKGLIFLNKTQNKSFLRNYGYFNITHDLKKDGNLIDEGRFEAEDVIELSSGNKIFKNWNFSMGQNGIKFGLETVVNGDSKGAFYADYTQVQGITNPQNDSVLYSNVMPLDSSQGQARLKFQYFVSPKFTFPYVRISWALKLHNATGGPGDFLWLSYNSLGEVSFSIVEAKNDIYVGAFNQFNTFDILANISPAGTPMDSFQIFIYFHNHLGRDFADETALRAFDLRSQPTPRGIKKLMAGDVNETFIYTSEFSADADDFPKVVRPDTFVTEGAGIYGWLWKLDEIINLDKSVGLVDRFKFDNVSLAFYPLVLPDSVYIDPPEDLSYSQEVSTFVVSNLEKEVLLGDMIRFDELTTRNEKNLYRSYFRFEDGTPTRFWSRRGVVESKNLLQITLEDYIAQFSMPQKKISADFLSNKVFHYVNCLRDNADGVRYRPMSFQFTPKHVIYSMDLFGVTAGPGGGPPYAPGAYNKTAFSEGFLIGN